MPIPLTRFQARAAIPLSFYCTFSSKTAKDAIIDLRSRQTRTCSCECAKRASKLSEPSTSQSDAARVKGYWS